MKRKSKKTPDRYLVESTSPQDGYVRHSCPVPLKQAQKLRRITNPLWKPAIFKLVLVK